MIKVTTGGCKNAFAIFFWFSTVVSTAEGFVIAPPWANKEVNPCSNKSWQLLLWPQDGQCYRIFDQGPCPKTQVLVFDNIESRARCQCPKELVFWAPTDRCYPPYEKGPCEVNQYLDPYNQEDSSSSKKELQKFSNKNALLASKPKGKPQCRNIKRCPNGWVFWPTLNDCFQLYTQGPCHKGDLLIVNPLTAEPFCGCDPILLRQYFYTPLNLCYEHNTRGPCEAGLLFAYNHTSDNTQCLCTPDLPNYHPESGQCFQFGSKGPCSYGQVFELRGRRGLCVCKDNYVFWPATRSCYKAFTPGPCDFREFIIPAGDVGIEPIESYEDDSFEDETSSRVIVTVGKCVENPCPKAHLYFPMEEDEPAEDLIDESDSGIAMRRSSFSDYDHDQEIRCYKVGSKGPCPEGQLVVFEKYSGKSFRGDCGCSSGYNQNYWPPTGECFEWYSQGPCPDSFLFRFNKDTGATECACDSQEGYVHWNETGLCYQVYTQGPCPENAWLIPTSENENKTEVRNGDDVFCECKPGFQFDAVAYACRLKEEPRKIPATSSNSNWRSKEQKTSENSDLYSPRRRASLSPWNTNGILMGNFESFKRIRDLLPGSYSSTSRRAPSRSK